MSMTALTEYQRLEAPGIWRPAPDEQRREVVVSVGKATLVLTGQGDQALTHWSLAALERINPGKRPARYKPGPDAVEELEISEETMVDAIEKVRLTVERARPKPGRLRSRIALLVVAVAFTSAVFLVPDALIRHANRIAPDAARTEIGQALLTEITRLSGARCNAPAGAGALERFQDRLDRPEVREIVILPGGVPTALHLPGGIVVLNRSLVEDFETPEIAAGYVLAEATRASSYPPMLRLFDSTGPRAAVDFLTRGELRQSTISGHAEFLVTSRPTLLEDVGLIASFAAAEIRSTPFAYALDVSGETTLNLIEADPVSPTQARPVIADTDWVALQSICGG